MTPLGVAIAGHGMMGAWHAEAFAAAGCRLRVLVGRRPDATAEAAARLGFDSWTTSLDEAVRRDDVDAVVLATPSEQHAAGVRLVLSAGKHVLVEIPLAMSLADAEDLVASADAAGVRLGVVHPLRFRAELLALRRRVDAGEERVRRADGRFFIRRLENVGATGYRRSWTDNLLWHHLAHVVDAGLWLLGADAQRVHGVMPSPEAVTGIPMEASVLAATADGRALACTGTYYGSERLFELMAVTEQDSYRLDVFGSTFSTGAGARPAESEQAVCAALARDFVEALRRGREPGVTGAAVLPALRVLERVQRQWDDEHGPQALPGRPV